MIASPSPLPALDRRAVALLLAATLTTMANAAISPALPGLEARFAEHPHAALLTRFLVPAPSVAVVLIAGWAGLLADRAQHVTIADAHMREGRGREGGANRQNPVNKGLWWASDRGCVGHSCGPAIGSIWLD